MPVTHGRRRQTEIATLPLAADDFNLLVDRDVMDGLFNVPLQILHPPGNDVLQENLEIENCESIGSYNWVEHETPTIMVPGSPPLWRNREFPYTVKPDLGFKICDQNGYRMPQSILLPLIVSVNKCLELRKEHPFEWRSVDIVTDRNALRKLMRWANGTAKLPDFRFDLQLAGDKTVLLSRFTIKIAEVLDGRYYRHNFEKAAMRRQPGCEACLPVDHYRVVTYDMNGLKMVVRFEVDACLTVSPSQRHEAEDSLEDISAITRAIATTSLASSTSTDSKIQTESDTGLLIEEG